jgi:hypothetical protein
VPEALLPDLLDGDLNLSIPLLDLHTVAAAVKIVQEEVFLTDLQRLQLLEYVWSSRDAGNLDGLKLLLCRRITEPKDDPAKWRTFSLSKLDSTIYLDLAWGVMDGEVPFLPGRERAFLDKGELGALNYLPLLTEIASAGEQ